MYFYHCKARIVTAAPRYTKWKGSWQRSLWWFRSISDTFLLLFEVSLVKSFHCSLTSLTKPADMFPWRVNRSNWWQHWCRGSNWMITDINQFNTFGVRSSTFVAIAIVRFIISSEVLCSSNNFCYYLEMLYCSNK